MAKDIEIKRVKNLSFGILILLVWFWITNPPAREAVGINLLLTFVGGILVYGAFEYRDDAVGIRRDNLFASIGWGILFTGIFLLVTLFVPGMSIGLPTLPASISDELRFVLVVLVAPIVETIFFQGALIAFLSNLEDTKKVKKETTQKTRWMAIIVHALLFSSFHVGAYISGFYQYPGFTEGLTAISANISSFFVAFLFAMFAGWFVTKKKVKNLIFAMVFHMGLNLIAYSFSVAVIVNNVLPLLSCLI